MRKKHCFIAVILLLLFSALFQGCMTNKIVSDTGDSLRVETVEKIIKDTVTVTVEIPVEIKQRETRDSTSFLETTFARSTASLIWKSDVPFLFHSLENKPQQIAKP